MKKKLRLIIFILVACTVVLVVLKQSKVLPIMVIYGKIVDEAGIPVGEAEIRARFGVTYDAPVTHSSREGRFLTSIFAFSWDNSGKGPPSIIVSRQGYRNHLTYFNKKKSGGLIMRNVNIKLLHGPQELEVREDL
jgi:hypothetical protein